MQSVNHTQQIYTLKAFDLKKWMDRPIYLIEYITTQDCKVLLNISRVRLFFIYSQDQYEIVLSS